VKKLPLGILISFILHATLYGGAMAWMAYDRAHPDAIDIDLGASSLILRPHNGGPMPANVVPPQPWVLSSGRLAPMPQALTYTPVAQTEAVGVACPPPCPDNGNDWMPASAASEKPRWVGNFLTDADYPKEARQRGQTGRVDVQLLIDAQGVVRDVKVLAASHPLLTEVVLKKLREAKFRPAYDGAGNAVPSRLKMPIVFELN
jgi:TonB family protein